MAASFGSQPGERGVQWRQCVTGIDVLDPGAVTIQQVERHIDLPPRGMSRERPQHISKRVGNSDVPGANCKRAVVIIDNDARRQIKHRRLGFAPIRLQRGERRHWIIIDVERMRLDQVEQRLHRQCETRNGIPERRRDRVCRRLASPLPIQDIAPPLQADLAGHRLARTVAHADDFAIEGVKREQRPPSIGGREQRGEKPVLVGRTDQFLAVAIVLVHRRTVAKRAVQSTAIRAAPTLRPSPNKTL